MILVDTSVWIDFRRGTASPVAVRLRAAIQNRESIATTGIVVLELLAGARDELDAKDLRQLLARCRFLKLDEPSDEEVAASLYRACRRSGRAIRAGPDCLIAAVAIRTRASLLHRDADFDVIARNSALVIESA
ncbi:MAG: type II toxin-antitoxin system VapC family toxin [Gaiellaceae bacterium]